MKVLGNNLRWAVLLTAEKYAEIASKYLPPKYKVLSKNKLK